MSARMFMEQSVPELEDLQRKGLFERREITMIMRRRTDFEQRTQGRGAQAKDFLRYAQFETNLDKLRLKRMSRLSQSGAVDSTPSISDKAGFRRVISIFDRGVRKFPAEMDLWKNYIAYAKDKDAVRVVYRVYGKLLSLQPRNTEAWISAAKYEFEENANARGARDLYMRGLRFNSDNERLWLSYAQFELAYVAKLLTRRKVMGLVTEKEQRGDLDTQREEYEHKVRSAAHLDSDSNASGIEGNDDIIRIFDEEEGHGQNGHGQNGQNGDSVQSDQSGNSFHNEDGNASGDLNVLGNPESNPVLKGDIALALFDSCVAEMAKDVAADMKEPVTVRTCRRFLALFDQYDVLNRDYLASHVLRFLQTSYPSSEETVFLDITFPLRNVSVSDPELAESLQLSVNKYLAYKKKATPEQAPVFTKRFIEYLSEKYVDVDEPVSEKTTGLLKAIIQKCS